MLSVSIRDHTYTGIKSLKAEGDDIIIELNDSDILVFRMGDIVEIDIEDWGD